MAPKRWLAAWRSASSLHKDPGPRRAGASERSSPYPLPALTSYAGDFAAILEDTL